MRLSHRLTDMKCSADLRRLEFGSLYLLGGVLSYVPQINADEYCGIRGCNEKKSAKICETNPRKSAG